MYIGRDMTELTMLLRNEWKEDEITFFKISFTKGTDYVWRYPYFRTQSSQLTFKKFRLFRLFIETRKYLQNLNTFFSCN